MAPRFNVQGWVRATSQTLLDGKDGRLTLNAAGSMATGTNAYRPDTSTRFPHRNAVTAVDKLAVPGALTLSAITEGGSNLANVAYYVGTSAGNRWGPTGPGTIPSTITPTANQAVRNTFSAVTGADYYDIFLSTNAAPLWVGRITEAQRAAGGIISTVGVYSAGGSPGSIDIGIVGTGLATNVNPFISNNAYTPFVPVPISCVGFSRAHVLVKTAVTDLRSLPTLSIVPFLNNQASHDDWHQGTVQAVSTLTAVGQSLEQDFQINVDGSTGLVILVDTISGQGTAASIWVELA